MWTWRQTAGELWRDGQFIAKGYSGFESGRNNPALQGVRDIGPIPRGQYEIGVPEAVLTPGPHGPFVLPLTPAAGTDTHGRAGFLIHGDSVQHPGGASHGCIILPRPIREEIAALHDIDLEVVV